jgi:hypothetical protein
MDGVVTVFRAVRSVICRTWRLNAELRDEIQPTPQLRWLNVGCILLILATTALAYEDGLSKGLHRVVPDSVDALAQTVGIHISQKFHRTTGYVGRTEVLQVLFRGGFTSRQPFLDGLGIQYPANVDMPDLINKAIENALDLKDLPPDATFTNRKLYAPQANDPGFVDYVKWSFEIFGYRAESLYHFYFLILAVAVALYLISFHSDILPLVTLAGLLVAFLMVLDSRLFPDVYLRTVHNQRILGALCFVSYLHLLFVFVIYPRPTPIRLLATALQVALFSFVMFTRSSAIWLVIAFVLIVIVNVLNRSDRPPAEQTGGRALKLILSWPVIFLTLGLAGFATYRSLTLHPIYSVGIFLPYHMVWHNAYIGLGLHPDWASQGDRYDGRPIPEAMSDNVAWLAAAAEATERYGLPEAYLFDGDIGG